MGETRTRKRARATAAASLESDDGKKRGRPRVEKQDESAADRRRTQIRMAQRAYRQRKEGVLEDLRKRVSGLTTTIELMNRAFVEYRDRVSISELSPQHMRNLRSLANQFDNLMRSVRNPEDESDLGDVDGDEAELVESSSRPKSTAKSMEPRNVPSWIDKSTLSQTTKQKHAADATWGYSIYMQGPDYMDTAADNFAFETPSAPLVASDIAPDTPDLNPTELFRAEIPESVQMPLEMSPIFTFSFQETSFARRLQRASLERASQILADPAKFPTTYERVFALPRVGGRDRTKMLASLKAVLARGPHESLDLVDPPRIHVGGAGTHYPRRDPFTGLWQPRKPAVALGTVGTQTLALLQNAAREDLTTAAMVVQVAGYEGEWFDPHDVEGYLAEKGIFIDPSSTFAEAEVWDPAAVAAAADVGSGPASTMTPSPPAAPLAPRSMSGSTISVGDSSPATAFLSSSPEMSTPFDAEQMAELGAMNIQLDSEWDGLFTAPLYGAPSAAAVTTEGGGWFGLGSSDVKTPLFLLGSGDQDDDADPLDLLFDRVQPEHSRRQRRTKRMLIDISKLVGILTVSGICLGSMPGFRRSDVDRALILSSFDAL